MDRLPSKNLPLFMVTRSFLLVKIVSLVVLIDITTIIYFLFMQQQQYNHVFLIMIKVSSFLVVSPSY